jgi:hypothetical protein
MKPWLKKLQVSQSQKELHSLARWGVVRAKGRDRFVLRTTLSFTLIMIPTRDFIDYLVDGRMQPWSEKFWLDAAVYFITGIVAGYASWTSMEGKYKDALRERRIAAQINSSRPFEP